jgi:hypothetical protein
MPRHLMPASFLACTPIAETAEGSSGGESKVPLQEKPRNTFQLHENTSRLNTKLQSRAFSVAWCASGDLQLKPQTTLEPLLRQVARAYCRRHPLLIQTPKTLREMIEGEVCGIEVEFQVREEHTGPRKSTNRLHRITAKPGRSTEQPMDRPHPGQITGGPHPGGMDRPRPLGVSSEPTRATGSGSGSGNTHGISRGGGPVRL